MKRLILLAMLACPLWAESKTEAALRVQLAAAEASLAAANKVNADNQEALTQAIARLSTATRQATGKQGAAADIAARQREQAATLADANATLANRAVGNAEDANRNAMASAAAAKVQTDLLVRISDQNSTAVLATLITTAGGFATLLAGFLWKGYLDARDHRWLVEASTRTENAANAAFKEANNVNVKIASIGLKLADDPTVTPALKYGEPHA